MVVYNKNLAVMETTALVDTRLKVNACMNYVAVLFDQ